MMKNNIKNIATVCIASITLLACNDWTDVENIKVNQPDVKEINSEQYAQYLQKLRTYKDSEHKFVYASFEKHRLVVDIILTIYLIVLILSA